MSEEDNKRVLPRSDLDFNLMTTDTVWGSSYVNSELRNRIRQYRITLGKDGKQTVTSDSMWSMLSFFTRDLRLANLNKSETNYANYYLDLANDFLLNHEPEAFLIALERVASVLELSQSKGGFLRKRMNTLTTENFKQEEPPKTKMMGKSTKGDY
jgi:hypothetical protein